MELSKRKQEMEEYAKLHKLEACKNYGYEDEDNNNILQKIKLASYIHNNYSDDTNINNKNVLLTILTCMTEKQKKLK